MSRATEIALALILLQASIGFVDAVGMFDTTYVATVRNNASYNLTHLSSYENVNENDIFAQAAALADMFIGTFLIGLKMVFSVIIIFPTLITRFHIPLEISVFIQAGIYYVYATWYAQYRSGKGWTQYE